MHTYTHIYTYIHIYGDFISRFPPRQLEAPRRDVSIVHIFARIFEVQLGVHGADSDGKD